MLRVSLGFRGTDTHGLKAFRRIALLDIVADCLVDRDVFASEFVIRADRGRVRINEIPVRVVEKRPPSINLFKRVPNVLQEPDQAELGHPPRHRAPESPQLAELALRPAPNREPGGPGGTVGRDDVDVVDHRWGSQRDGRRCATRRCAGSRSRSSSATTSPSARAATRAA